MISRPFGIQRIEQGWERRPIEWLSGERRAGKTTLARMFAGAVYLNCDFPSVIRRSENKVDAIECKYNPDRLDISSLLAFYCSKIA